MENCECTNGCKTKTKFVLKGEDILHGLPGEFKVVKCEKCGLCRTNPRPEQHEIGKYYPDDYSPYNIINDTSHKKRNHIRNYIYTILDLENRRMPNIEPGSLLEIGCSTGAYMQKARDLGWKCDGIEFSEEIANICRKKGFNVQSCTVEKAIKPEYKYDLIVAWMVIEHLYDPVESLKKLASWSSDKCVLIGSVPDFGCLERKIFGKYWYALQLPTHLYHFNKDSLRITLENSGWILTKIRWQRDCKNLLWSIELAARGKKLPKLEKIAAYLRISNKLKFLRIIISLILGQFAQSGRLEFEARRSNQ